jgi:SAM-dependent methyltransferase
MPASKTKRYVINYMKEEYGDLNAENKFVGKHLFQNARGSTLDFGCGPNLLYWSIFMQNSSRIDGFDILPENIRYVKSTLALRGKRLGFDSVLEYVRKLPNSKRDAVLKDSIGKIKRLKTANMLKRLPFPRDFYDTVTEIGSIGCVDTEAELLAAAENMHRCLKGGQEGGIRELVQ